MRAAGAVASSVGLLSRPAIPAEGEIIYFWGCGLIVLNAVM